MTKTKWTAAAVAIAPVLAPRLAQACAMCGLSPGDTAAHAFNSSVIFMMAAPYSLFGIAVAGGYIVYRRARRHRGTGGRDGAGTV